MFRAGICLNPHPQKRHKGGEDACCVTDNLISVADGVGGWAESGIDPAIFSRKLCANIEAIALEADDVTLMKPVDILVDAVKNNKETGSATCVICTLDKVVPVVYTANLGDSGYMILRRDGYNLEKIFRTKE